MTPGFRALAFAAASAIVAATTPAALTANGTSIIVQSTTSTKNSGLYDHLLPIFEKKTGIKVHVVAVGTGQAIRNARNCDGDVLLVHAKSAEEQFVAAGHGLARADLMYNDFVFVGPPGDPAKIGQAGGAVDALKRIAAAKQPFASRGDDSGTHKKEKTLWQSAGYDPAPVSGTWYRETGQGMGATLNIAIGMGAYVMTDRATWLNFRNRQNFKILFEGDSKLFNQYGVISLNPKKCPSVKSTQAKTFIDWLLSEQGQDAIAAYKVAGKQLFFPNAKQ